jgi:biotin operon repressor
MTRPDAYWLRLEAEYHRDPVQGNFGPAYALDNPAGFRAYALMSRYSPNHTIHKISDLYGRERWLNDKGWRVMCLALLAIASGTETSTRELAEKIGCCRMTVSRWITKLTAWGVIGSGVVRGRYGGIVLFARRQGDNLEHWANVARAKIAAIRARKLNAHPPLTEDGSTSASYPVAYSPSKYVEGVHLNSERLIDALGLDRSRTSGRIPCPAHGEGRKLTLAWKITQERVLLHCFAGCTFQEIKQAVL